MRTDGRHKATSASPIAPFRLLTLPCFAFHFSLPTSPPESLLQMDTYLRKSYYKTASLVCYACRSVALLGGHAYNSEVATACEEFGYHLGLAYQVQDDILDFTGVASVLGKPALADMDLGLSTAPILYAAQEYSALRPLVMRRFKVRKIIGGTTNAFCISFYPFAMHL